MPIPDSESSLSSSVERIEITFTLNINRQRLAPDAVISEGHEQTRTIRRRWECAAPDANASAWKTMSRIPEKYRKGVHSEHRKEAKSVDDQHMQVDGRIAPRDN